VIQKLLEFGGATQRRTLLNQLIGNMVELSMHMYGCRVVQKAIELGEEQQKKMLVGELRGQFVEFCVED